MVVVFSRGVFSSARLWVQTKVRLKVTSTGLVTVNLTVSLLVLTLGDLLVFGSESSTARNWVIP